MRNKIEPYPFSLRRKKREFNEDEDEGDDDVFEHGKKLFTIFLQKKNSLFAQMMVKGGTKIGIGVQNRNN